MEKKLQAEIRRRAFERADHRSLEQNHRRNTDLTLDALGEVTGLSRSELEQIATEVRASFERPRRDYFSIKAQLILVLGSIGVLILLLYLLVGWIF
jgi:2'-5' RNA ligase